MKRLTAILVVIAFILPLVPSFGVKKKTPQPGMLVWSIDKDGPAARAGVQEDDLLLSCDGKPIVFVSSLEVISNKARRDGKKSVKLTVKREEKELKLELPVSDIPGIDLRPPISDLIAVLYYGCLTSSTPVETDNVKLVAQLVEAARNVAEDDGDIRLAAWTWRMVYKLSLDKSADQRRAAEMFAKLSAGIGDGPGEAEGLFMQGIIAQKDGDLKSVDDYITRALKIQEELLPGSPLESLMRGRLTTVLVPLGIAAHNESKLTLTAEYEKRVLKLAQQLLSDDESREYALQLMSSTLSMLAALSVQQNDIEAGENYLRQEIDVREKIGPESEAMAQAWLRLSQLKHQHGDPKEAKECYQKALPLFQKLNPDHPSVAAILYRLGWITQRLGDLEEAREYEERAVRLYERLSPDSTELSNALDRLGSIIYDQKDLNAAIDCYKRALAIFEKLSPESMDVALCLGSIGMALEDQGQLEAARDCYERALKIKEKICPDSTSVVGTLRRVGSLAESQGDLRVARDYYERALALAERIVPDSLDVARCLNDLAATLNHQGDPVTACKLYERAISIKERLEPDSESLATSLNNLGSVYREQGQLKAARQHYERALEIRERLSPDSLDMAISLNSLGLLTSEEGDIELALKHLNRALEIVERLAPESSQLASTLANIGCVVQSQGDLETALAHFERALAIHERIAPGTIAVTACLNNLGSLASDRGDIKAAREFYERALAILEKVAPDSLDVATILNNLGILAGDQGDFKAAREFYNRSLEIKERLSPDSLGVAITLSNLGSLALFQGDYQAALDYHRRALAIEERLAPDSLQVASSLNNIACVLDDTGDIEGALSYYQRALAIKQKYAPGSLAVAVTLSNLGTLASRLDDDKLAREYYEKALKIRERLAPDSMDAAYSLHNLGRVISRQGDIESALDYIARSIGISRKQNGLGLLSGALNYRGQLQRVKGENEAALKSFKEAVEVFESIRYTDADSRERVLADSESRLYDDLIQLLLEMNKPDEALQYLERAKSKAVVDALNVSSIRTGNEALTNLLKRYADLQAQLKLQQQAIEKEKQKPEGERSLVKIEQLTKLLAQTKAEFYQVVTKIRKDYGPEYSALVQVEPAEFSRIQKELPAGAVVVEYFPAADKLYIFLVTRDSFKVIEHAVTRDQLDEWVGEVREAMDDWKNGLGSQTPPEALVHLYDNIIKPVEDEIDANKTVVFIPSGTLCYLPFVALARKTDDGGLHYLVEREKQFVTLTQMGLLGKLLANDKAASGGRSVGAIAFGNPSGISPALPSAEAEVNTIADIYPDSQAFTGEDASEWRVKLQAQYGRIVHLATHGLLRHDDPNESYIALSEGKDEDGRLTEGEIFGLPLEGTRLVVLSACQTAVAEDNPGREISSLAQAFAIAGAPTVIASLWSVSDASTGKLMSELYRKLAEGKSKAEALQSAQRLLIAGEEHRHPFFWAGFTLLGAWE